ncbi:helix-turn-helix transcriptional regulator [Paenibacillus lautus]|uniref:helix-turn-helix transcriptional regulator n=1 Tax=Paenibacillus lautus TaxID=1401 RepID=UPI003D28FC73
MNLYIQFINSIFTQTWLDTNNYFRFSNENKRTILVIECLSSLVFQNERTRVRANRNQFIICDESTYIGAIDEPAVFRGISLRTTEPISLPILMLKGSTERTAQVFLSKIQNSHQENTNKNINTNFRKELSEIYSIISENCLDIHKKHQQSKRVAYIDSRLIFIHRYLRKHFSKPLTLQMLADLIQCNPVYLCNTYKKVFQIPPIKHLQKYRMDEAKKLLIETNMSISEISQSLSYVSSSHFTNYFKRHFSITPLEYRKRELHHTKQQRTRIN